MKSKSTIKVSFLFLLLAIIGCKSKTDEVCECLEKSANTYMVKGEMASENDLYTLCNQFEGSLKGAGIDEKRKVQACLDTVNRHIRDKELFSDIEKVSLPPISCGNGLMTEIKQIEEKYASNNNRIKEANYLYKGRKINCTMVVESISKTDDKVEVTGYLYDENIVLEDTYIFLRLPEKEYANIKTKTEKGGLYRQIIKFEGNFLKSNFNEVRLWGYDIPVRSLTFISTEYELIKPDRKIHKSTGKKEIFSYD